MDIFMKFFIFLYILMSYETYISAIVSPCDDNFTIDSYAITILESNSSDQQKGRNVLEFMSHSFYYWLQNVPAKRDVNYLPNNEAKVDAAFFLDTLDCSKNSSHLITIENNTFNTFSIETNEWKTNQFLKEHPFLRIILAPITDNMKIDAITDWKPNRVIVFRDKTYRVFEWQNICDALNGKGIQMYPPFKTSEWFANSDIDSAQLIVVSKGEIKQSLYLFSGKYFREMIVKDLNKTSGQIIGELNPQKDFKKMFVCVKEEIHNPVEAEPAVGGHTRRPFISPTVKEPISPLPAIICAVVLLSIILFLIYLILPKEKYIIALKD